jgi:hypothetical protein
VASFIAVMESPLMAQVVRWKCEELVASIASYASETLARAASCSRCSGGSSRASRAETDASNAHQPKAGPAEADWQTE